jgi:imidazole glycerol-phosphate synthase subunit HisF
MLRSRIIPVLLIRDGGLVKTRRFAEDKYVGDPINAVKIFNEKEVDELSIFDIDASVKQRPPDFDHLQKIAVESRMPLSYGGGIDNAEQAARIIGLGYEKISVSSAAVARPKLVRELADRVGTQSVAVTIDVKSDGIFGGYSIYTRNGQQKHKLKLAEFVEQMQELGAGEIIINNIDRDGMMQGYDLKLAKMIRNRVTVPLTFVGGVGTTQHMADLIDAVGVIGAAAGSFFVFKGTYRAVLISYARPDVSVGKA